MLPHTSVRLYYQALAKQSAATLLKDMLGSSMVATKRQMQNKAKAIELEEQRNEARQQVIIITQTRRHSLGQNKRYCM